MAISLDEILSRALGYGAPANPGEVPPSAPRPPPRQTQGFLQAASPYPGMGFQPPPPIPESLTRPVWPPTATIAEQVRMAREQPRGQPSAARPAQQATPQQGSLPGMPLYFGSAFQQPSVVEKQEASIQDKIQAIREQVGAYQRSNLAGATAAQGPSGYNSAARMLEFLNTVTPERAAMSEPIKLRMMARAAGKRTDKEQAEYIQEIIGGRASKEADKVRMAFQREDAQADREAQIEIARYAADAGQKISVADRIKMKESLDAQLEREEMKTTRNSLLQSDEYARLSELTRKKELDKDEMRELADLHNLIDKTLSIFNQLGGR